MDQESVNQKMAEILEEYFTVEEWMALPDIDQKRNLTTLKNYLTFPEIPGFGNVAPVPDFMRNGTKKKKKYIQHVTPNTNKETSAKNKTIAEVLNLDDKGDKLEYKDKILDANKTKKRSILKTTENVHKYPKRNVERKNYQEEDIPADDRYIFCDFCQEPNLDFCSKCGMLVMIKDNPVEMGVPQRARLTVPRGILEVRPSAIHGFGVFALKFLKKGAQLGPYEGKIGRVDSSKGYSWRLHDGQLVDASDETQSNYLRYVNCARNVNEQNLVAFQYQGQLYYRTSKDIQPGSELLVFYGKSYAELLGVNTIKYFEPEEENIEVDFYSCVFCHVGLRFKDHRDKHQMICKFQPRNLARYDESFECKHCQCTLTSLQFLQDHERMCRKKIKPKCTFEQKKRFACNYCEYVSQARGHLNKHVNGIHKKEKVYKCAQCEFQTCYPGSIFRHGLIHEKVHKFSCQICKNGFNEKKVYDNHLLKHHPDMTHVITSKIHRCSICTYATIKSTDLSSHTLQHSKENVEPFSCGQCHYKTYYKSHLKRHILIHGDQKPWICARCKDGFNSKKQLDVHILNHHKDDKKLVESITNKINSCCFCQYETIYKNNLTQHMKKHK